jgi:transcriptional regulator with XRE-family HTH domain
MLTRKQLGARIREKRTAAGLSQKELALMIGVPPDAIARYESDQATPSLERLEAIAQRLQCGLETLIYDK